MNILSVFRKTPTFINQSIIKSLCKHNGYLKNAVRHSGNYDPRKMYLSPSKRQFQRFNDMMHFYFFLGIIPLTSIVTYVNLTVGPAKLRAIPDDYRPDHWEYHKNPICRWFARYIYEDHQETYEKYIYQMWSFEDICEMDMLTTKVQHLRSIRQDTDDAEGMRRMPLDYIKMVREQAEWQKENDGICSE